MMITTIDESFQAAREAERALLGGLLIAGADGGQTAATGVQKIMSPSDFLDHAFPDDLHARIFQAMIAAGKSDQITVARQLNAEGKLKKGDCAYLAELVAASIGIDYTDYARAVHEYAEQRRSGKPSASTGTDIPLTLELPAIAWRGLFGDYRDLVGETTEAADAFHYAAFCQVLGCTIGRRLHVYHANNLYPNFYICLVGRSGLTRKDTCWARANALLTRLHHVDPDGGEKSPPFRIVRGIRSYEGLLDELAGEHKIRAIYLGELLSLLAKAKQESLGNIIPQLTELYDCPDCVNPPVHQKEVIDCREPFVSIMAGTTLAWLQKALTERDIYGGFANRWLYVSGLPKEPKPNPPRMDIDKRDALIEAINTIRCWAKDAPNDGELQISNEANALFDEYYTQYYRRCQFEGLTATIIQRVQDFIWKFALLYAAIDLSEIIRADHIKPAIAVGDYLESSVTEVFRSFGMTKDKQAEMKLEAYLRSKGQPIEYRDLYRNLSMSAKELNSILEPLIRLGTISNTYITDKTGKRTRMLEVA